MRKFPVVKVPIEPILAQKLVEEALVEKKLVVVAEVPVATEKWKMLVPRVVNSPAELKMLAPEICEPVKVPF